MPEWPPLDRTLGPEAFYSLYRGALAADSVQRRLSRCYAVLLAGRLGLRPGEILHCHEGWIDWGRGELRVPALDPCACAECWAGARARQAAGDERPLDEIARTEQWSPSTDAGVRTVAFGWSERITGLLASFFDYLDYLDGDRATVAELVSESAAAAEGIDDDAVTPAVLRATGGRFFAEVGFDATSVRGLLGLRDRETAEAFVRHAGQRTSATLYRAFDRDAVGPDVPPADPARKFPIACDPASFTREPFTAGDFGPDARFERAENVSGRRVRNPRPAAVPDGFDYDPGDHEMPEAADPAGGQFSRSAGAEVDDVAALRDWITRKDASLRPGSEGVASDATVAPGADRDAFDAAHAPNPGDGPPSEPESVDLTSTGESETVAANAADPDPVADTGSGDESEKRTAADGAAVEGPTGSGGSTGRNGDDAPATVEEAVTQPLVARIGTRFATPEVADGHPVEGLVALGQNELLFVSPATDEGLDVDHVAVQRLRLDRIVDVVPDVDEGSYGFDSSLGIVYGDGDGRDVAVLGIEPERKWDLWIALFRNALHVSRLDVTHPARVGGRVTDESATAAMLYLDRDRVRFTPLGSDATLVSISLDAVLHVERTRQSVDGERQPALAVQQFADGEAVTSLVGCSSTRTLALFERFVRRDYRERLADARSLSIPDPEKEVLVALYSTGEAVDLTGVFTRDVETLRDDVAALESKGLVTTDRPEDTELTARGRLVVSDRLESVND